MATQDYVHIMASVILTHQLSNCLQINFTQILANFCIHVQYTNSTIFLVPHATNF